MSSVALYHSLLELCTTHEESFYFSDQEYHDGCKYRIFLYRFASYTEFCAPNALESRGIMFRTADKTGKVLLDPYLVCRPMTKFFNLNENPFTLNLDLSLDNIDHIELKADGSLISTFIDGESNLGVKSKGSLHSPQAIAALQTIKNNPALYDELLVATTLGLTINMEFVAPENRIVVSYDRPHLIILNARSRVNGDLHNWESFKQLSKVENLELASSEKNMFPQMLTHWVADAKNIFNEPYDRLISNTPEMVGIEGFIVYLKSGQVFKLKTSWYLTLHHNKDRVTTDKSLFEVTLCEGADDLRSLFFDDPQVLGYMDKMHIHVATVYNDLVSKVESFYKDHKHLDRKEYAIAGQAQLDSFMFGLAMSQYLQRPVSYKDAIMRNVKNFLPNPPIIPLLTEINID